MSQASPIRTCVGCRARRPQAELIRFRRRRDGHVVVALDPRSRVAGRSAYLCPSKPCYDRALRRRTLSRTLAGPRGLAVTVPDGLWPAVLDELDCALARVQKTSIPASTTTKTQATLESLAVALRRGAVMSEPRPPQLPRCAGGPSSPATVGDDSSGRNEEA